MNGISLVQILEYNVQMDNHIFTKFHNVIDHFNVRRFHITVQMFIIDSFRHLYNCSNEISIRDKNFHPIHTVWIITVHFNH